MYDVCIIGAGVVGANIARELSRYQLNICVLDREDDVSCGCSKANSGIVHGGYSDKPGTLKAELCVKGNRMYAQLDEELHFGYREIGSYVLSFDQESLATLRRLFEQGQQNGVGGLELIDGEEMRRREPHVSAEVTGALYCAQAGVTSPYEFVIALMENAVANGVELKLRHEVRQLEKRSDHFLITTTQGTLSSRYVINAAGAHSDNIAAMAGLNDYQITPRRGQYLLLSKAQNYLANSVIFQVPTALGKGILVTPTYHGNLMLGPNAEEIDDKNDVSTDDETLRFIAQTARLSVPGFDMRQALTSFAGNRPVSNQKDWVIDASRLPGLINLIGIDSPGLTSSPAIALKVVTLLQDSGLHLEANPHFQAQRAPIIRPKSEDFQGTTTHSDPALHLICRCENVTEAEILDCFRRGLPVLSVDAVKRRTRAGMGLCQGTFCGPRVRALLAQELQMKEEDIPQRGHSSTLAERARKTQLKKL